MAKASAIHVKAQSEAKDVRRLGFNNELIVTPLGVRVSECRPRCEKANHKRTLLFVGRSHRIKGLDRLLHAYSRVMAENWKQPIVGPDQEGHMEELKQLSAKLGITDSVEFAGPRYGQELKNTYASAECFFLPSYTENFGSVVVESLALGIPVIATVRNRMGFRIIKGDYHKKQDFVMLSSKRIYIFTVWCAKCFLKRGVLK